MNTTKEIVQKGYSCNSVEGAITEAKRFIERKVCEAFNYHTIDGDYGPFETQQEVQHKGYTILIRHYLALRHNRHKYPEVFDYVIFEERGEK